uniref:Non-specific serine/threonine protein kinase n=1 Tax=Piliocolobus tephrosceles TaxID=591936 RepID=A0A8C9H7A3_9PRIM
MKVLLFSKSLSDDEHARYSQKKKADKFKNQKTDPQNKKEYTNMYDPNKTNSNIERNWYFNKNEKNYYNGNAINCTLNDANNKCNILNNNLLYMHDVEEELNSNKHRRSFSVSNNKKDVIRPESFHFIKVIGVGSYGKVLLVKHVKQNKLYAMKILKKENIVSMNQLEHTIIERNVLKCVSHPFIVKMYYAFQTSKKLYYILEYCPGGELFFHLSKVRFVNEKSAKFYMCEIILALQYLHELNIIYRDLKPENVLIDEQGHIKLTDFGLSKEGITGSNSAKSLCGTPEYLAPEIIDKTGHGKAVDWWSLGIMLYEMLAGSLPFSGKNRSDLFEKIKNKKVTYPCSFSAAVVDLLKKLFEKNPKKRLGYGIKDAEDIKNHIFFKNVNWDDVLNKKINPPFKPNLFSKTDLQNFDKEFLCLPLRSSDRYDSNPVGLDSDTINTINDFNYNFND